MNALPGGMPVRDVMTNHRPDPKQHPGLVVVGDYLFDLTLNGLLDPSDAATDIIVTEMMRLRRARGDGGKPASDKIDRDYFENYRGLGPYQRGLEPVHRSGLPDRSRQDRLEPGQGLQAAGGRVRQRRAGGGAARARDGCLGYREQWRDPWRRRRRCRKFDKLGSIVDMPFKDDEFDFVFETSLCHVADKQVPRRSAN